MGGENLKSELCQMIRKLSYREGHFILTSGKESTFYVDLKNVTLHPRGAKLIGRLTWTRLSPHDFGGVGGPTLGADPLATALSLAALESNVEVPAFIIRKEPKKHGTSQWIEGREILDTSKELLLVEDVVTTGGSGVKAVEKIRAEGFQISKAIAILDRNEGAKDAFQKVGIELFSLTTIDEIQELGKMKK